MCCFENSSTPIAITVRCLVGDLFKPLLAELGIKNILKNQEELNKHANKHNEPVE